MKKRRSHRLSRSYTALLGFIAVLSAIALLLIDLFGNSVSGVGEIGRMPLKLVPALAFVWSVYSLMARRSRATLSSVQAGNIFRQAASYIFGSVVILIILGIIAPVSYTQGNLPANPVSLVLGFLLGLVCISVFLRQLYWFDGLLRLRRTRNTNRFRIALLIGLILLVVADYAGVYFGATRSIGPLGFNAVLALVLLFAIRRVSWLDAFSKGEKYKSFFISCGIILFVVILLAMEAYAGNENVLSRSMHQILPGLENLMYFSGLIALVYYSRIGFALLLALPTAAIIDRKIREVQSLSALGRRITQVSDSRQLMESVTKLVLEVCGATGAWIELVDSDGHRTVASKRRVNEQELARLYHRDVLKNVLRVEEQGLYIENIGERPELQELYPRVMRFARSLIAVPLTIENRNVGMLFVIHRNEFAFEPEDVSLIMAYADTISIAIENARLFESSLEKERYKSEMQVACEMQQKLLPKELPDLGSVDIYAYSSPAFEVGGDYYDFVRLADGEMCILIGDVSGKGISAAFYMAEVKGVVVALAKESHSPKELLEKVNNAVMGHIEKSAFVTMAAVAVARDARSVRIARAGHTPLLLCRNGHISNLTPRGIGIGLVQPSMFNSVLEEIRLEFSPDDRLLLYTDGVNEAQDRERNEFGVEALEAIVRNSSARRAEFLVGEIVRHLIEHAGEVSQNDDITIVAIVYNPELSGYNREYSDTTVEAA